MTLLASWFLQAAAPLPAEPPIGGVLWAVVVPALLLGVATAATVMLYRHFAHQETTEPSDRPTD